MTIKVTYNVTDVYMTQSVSPVYINVSYGGGTSGGGVWGTITGTLSNQTDLQTALDGKFDDPTGTTAQYLRGDGSLATFPSLTGYVPYTGATQAVNLGAYDLTVNELTIGKGLNGVANNTALGKRTLFHNTTGNYNTAVGHEAGHNLTTGQYNTAIGQSALYTATTAGQNTAIGLNALLYTTSGGSNVAMGVDALQHNTTGSSNTALGYNAGSHITGGSTPNTTATNSVFIGRDSKAAADGETNQIVIGQNAVGNGSNTATFGNTATTANYFTGSVNGGSFVKSGGTSSQFLKADGSVDSTAYVPTSRTITINGVSYDLSADRTWTVSGGISGSGTSGQVTYWSGASAVSGSNNLFWDNTNSRLGIGTNAPAYRLHNFGSSAFDNGASGDAITILNEGFLKWTSVRFRGSASSFQFQDNLFSSKISLSMSGSLCFFNTGGNYSFGTTSDLGTRLGVVGDTLLRGSGATSATTALTVQNSSSQNILRVLNNGEYRIGNGANFIYAFTYSSAYDTLDLNGANFSIYPSNGSIALGGGTQLQTSGNQNNVITKGRFQPSSGTATFADIRCEPLINQTGGANGITRGLYINPTLTAAADFRAIETTSGKIVFGNLPTSSAGLPSGALWNNAGVINIV